MQIANKNHAPKSIYNNSFSKKKNRAVFCFYRLFELVSVPIPRTRPSPCPLDSFLYYYLNLYAYFLMFKIMSHVYFLFLETAGSVWGGDLPETV